MRPGKTGPRLNTSFCGSTETRSRTGKLSGTRCGFLRNVCLQESSVWVKDTRSCQNAAMSSG